MSRKAPGRPLRFFLLLGVGWIGLRAAMLAGPPGDALEAAPLVVAAQASDAAPLPTGSALPDVPDPSPALPVAAALPIKQPTSQPTEIAALTPRQSAPRSNQRATAETIADREARIGVPQLFHPVATYSPGRDSPPAERSPVESLPVNRTPADRLPVDRPSVSRPKVAEPPVPPLIIPAATAEQDAPDRWHLGAWAFWRSGSGAAPLATQGGRLGGSQVGARLDYDLTPDWGARLAPYARLTSALDRPSSPEAAAGLAWQPSRRVPISLLAERRIALGKGGRNANALFVIGGFGPTLLAQGFHAEAYGQAGMVGFSRRDLVADGKVALLRALPRTPLSAGFSLSGGAQPGVSRLDVGPELRLRLPLSRANARLSVEWRQRIAGQAAPGSGLAVTLASDF